MGVQSSEFYPEESQDDDAEDGDEVKIRQSQGMEFDMQYWIKNFLYPFALDPAPLRLDASKQSPEEIIAEKKRQKLLGDESILNTTKYQFPVNQIKKFEHLIEI